MFIKQLLNGLLPWSAVREARLGHVIIHGLFDFSAMLVTFIGAAIEERLFLRGVSDWRIGR